MPQDMSDVERFFENNYPAALPADDPDTTGIKPVYIIADTQRTVNMGAIYVTQNDNVRIIVKIQQHGKDVPLEDDYTYTISSMRKDGVSVLSPPGVKTGANEVTFNLITQAVAVAGKVRTSVQIYNPKGRVSTLAFELNVAHDLASEYVPSENEQTLIEMVLYEAPAIIQEAKTQAERAEVAANSASQVISEASEVIATGTDVIADISTLKDETIAAKNAAETSALDAQLQGDYAKAEADRLVGTDVSVLDNKITTVTAQLAQTVDKRNAQYPIVVPTYDISNQAVHPSVLDLGTAWNGYRYWMAYTPYPSGNSFYENPCIAASTDMIHWVVPNGLTNPLDSVTQEEYDSAYHFSDTHLVFRSDLNRLEVWYRYNKVGVTEQIYRRTSVNGITWTSKELLIESDSITDTYLSPVIMYKDSLYKIWYVDGQYRLTYAESTNGNNWSIKSRKTIVFEETGWTLWHIDIVKTDLGYEALFNAFPSYDVNRRALFYSKSSDGLNWDTATTILKHSDDYYAWDSQQIYRATMIKQNGKYFVYYSASNRLNKWHIGLTIGTDILNLTGLSTPLANLDIDLEYQTKFWRAFLEKPWLYNPVLQTAFDANGKNIDKVNQITNTSGVLYALARRGTDNTLTVLSNGWTGTITYSKNDLGQISLRATLTAGTVTSGTVITAMPAGFIPRTANVPVLAWQTNGDTHMGLTLKTDGNFSIFNTTIVTGDVLHLHVIYQS